jgi:hypothetical protein
MVELLNDIVSHSKSRQLYAKKGDRVRIICDMGEVFIVEGQKSERFSVKKSDIKI